MPQPWPKWAMVVIAVLFCTTLAPLWWYPWVPAADLPNHTAIVSVLLRLWRGDAALASYYQVNIQPVPYYTFYALAVPLAAWLGVPAGIKMALTLLGLATMGAGAFLLHAAARPWPAALVSVLLFYGPIFFWGFVTTLAGVPCVLWGAGALLHHCHTGQKRWLAAAAVAAATATLSHVILLAAWMAYVVAFWSCSPRRHMRAAALMTLAGSAPLLPWAYVALTRWHLPSDVTAWQFETATTLLHHLKMHVAVFDRGLGRATHVLVLVILIALGIAARRRMRDPWSLPARFLGIATALLLALVMLTPVALGAAWGVNFRYLLFIEIGIMALVPTRMSLFAQNTLAGVLIILIGLHMAALNVFWRDFNRAAAPVTQLLAQMSASKTLLALEGPVPFAQCWPPVLIHLHAYYLADAGDYDSNVFAGAHLPIGAVRALRGGTRPPVLGDYDYALEQSELPDAAPAPFADAVLLHTAGAWRLYGRAEPRARTDML